MIKVPIGGIHDHNLVNNLAMRIQAISKDQVSLVQGFLFISSLDDAVFELVQNSLDAQACNISVRVNLNSLAIQIVDDGCGIHADELLMIGDAHGTCL